MDNSSLIESLLKAVTANPADVPLRCHLAALLIADARQMEAVPHAAAALQHEPDNDEARALMAQALSGMRPATGAPRTDDVEEPEKAPSANPGGFNWSLAEAQLDDVPAPMFVADDGTTQDGGESRFDVRSTGVTLADVGGMVDVKKRLNASFLAPLRNEALRAAYHKSLRGGLLLYGPPGCGKTFVARALAGELDIRFLAVSIADVLDMWVGNSEKNVHEIFEVARTNAPCVLFLDEVDAIGHKRSRLSSDAARGAVNQLLHEMDGINGANEGVYVLAATNAPWDVDPALRRPGRFDRTVLVTPPDLPAREHIWRRELSERPIEGINPGKLAKLTAGYSGADIAHLAETAAEHALMEAAETGTLRMIRQEDVEAAIAEVRPSVTPWFETARNVALFANEDGTYDELAAYLRKQKRL